MYLLNNWSVVCTNNNPFTAPECLKIQLLGFRDNDPHKIITSSIVSAEGRLITTKSGSKYYLVDINKEYLSWMKNNGYNFDRDNPIKLKR